MKPRQSCSEGLGRNWYSKEKGQLTVLLLEQQRRRLGRRWKRWIGIGRWRSLTSSESFHLLTYNTLKPQKKIPSSEKDNLLYQWTLIPKVCQISFCSSNFQFFFFENFGFRASSLPSVAENGGAQGETGQGRDSESYSGIRSCCVLPESTVVPFVSSASTAAAAADKEDSS